MTVLINHWFDSPVLPVWDISAVSTSENGRLRWYTASVLFGAVLVLGMVLYLN